MPEKVPESLNWVQLERKWDLAAAFKKLHDVVHGDAAESEKLLEEYRADPGRLNSYHSYFILSDSLVDGRFDVTASVLGEEITVRARISESRKAGRVHVEFFNVNAVGQMTPASEDSFTLEPRISDYGKQTFAVVDPNIERISEATLLYPWQVSRRVVDTLRRMWQPHTKDPGV